MADPDTSPDPTAAGAVKPKPASDPIDTRLVRRLADILKDTGLTEIEVERGDLRIRVARKISQAPMMAAIAAPAATAAPLAPTPSAPAVMTTDTGPERRGEVVKSPMVGTVYLQAQPGQPPFVRVGERVSEGQTLMIIEAIKTMNPIPAPRAGVLLEVLVGDAQPVEYGESLVVIE